MSAPDQVLVAEIGSTTTTVTALRGLAGCCPEFCGQGLSPTTVDQGDVRVGLQAALADLRSQCPEVDPDRAELLACSSAAGGLRMTVHGLVYDMTVKAASEAALGAGAIVSMVTAGDLTATDLDGILGHRPNIVLLAGGVDYGERETIVANARRLGDLGLEVPIIYAGNTALRDEIADILSDAELYLVDNVYPRIDQLNVEPTRRAIQAVFERHIVRAPGMAGVRELVGGEIMPVPGAVMAAAEALAPVIGDLLVVDVGGATTDVHSVVDTPPDPAALLVAPEPRAKRTVEGDLGVFLNAENLVQRVGAEQLAAALGFELAPVLESMTGVPATAEQAELILHLAREASAVALGRHAGRTRHMYGPAGRSTIIDGRDLSSITTVVGTGGVFSRLAGAGTILEQLLQSPPPDALYPRQAQVVTDARYIMAVAGVLSRRYPESARRLLLDSLGLEPAERGTSR